MHPSPSNPHMSHQLIPPPPPHLPLLSLLLSLSLLSNLSLLPFPTYPSPPPSSQLIPPLLPLQLIPPLPPPPQLIPPPLPNLPLLLPSQGISVAYLVTFFGGVEFWHFNVFAGLSCAQTMRWVLIMGFIGSVPTSLWNIYCHCNTSR